MSYYFELTKKLNAAILIVEHRDSYKFVTCNDKYTPSKISNSPNLCDCVTTYDIIDEKIINIPLVEIIRHYQHNIDDVDNNNSVMLSRANILREKINGYVAENTNSSFSQIYNLYIKPYIIDINNVADTPLLDFISHTKFILTYADIVSPIVAPHRKQSIVNFCNSIINLKLNEILSELNVIKQSSENAEDIEDIDTIIQMYNDCVSEIDYSKCKSLIDYLNVYPPLLLPLPENVDGLLSVLQKIHKNTDDYVEFMNIVDNSLTYSEITELLNELNVLQPEYKHESGEMDLTKFKNYLKYKLNNGHKQS